VYDSTLAALLDTLAADVTCRRVLRAGEAVAIQQQRGELGVHHEDVTEAQVIQVPSGGVLAAGDGRNG
jgi:hypothetical protein